MSLFSCTGGNCSTHSPLDHLAQLAKVAGCQVAQPDALQEVLVPPDHPAALADLVGPLAHQRAQRPRGVPTWT